MLPVIDGGSVFLINNSPGITVIANDVKVVRVVLAKITAIGHRSRIAARTVDEHFHIGQNILLCVNGSICIVLSGGSRSTSNGTLPILRDEEHKRSGGEVPTGFDLFAEDIRRADGFAFPEGGQLFIHVLYLDSRDGSRPVNSEVNSHLRQETPDGNDRSRRCVSVVIEFAGHGDAARLDTLCCPGIRRNDIIDAADAGYVRGEGRFHVAHVGKGVDGRLRFPGKIERHVAKSRREVLLDDQVACRYGICGQRHAGHLRFDVIARKDGFRFDGLDVVHDKGDRNALTNDRSHVVALLLRAGRESRQRGRNNKQRGCYSTEKFHIALYVFVFTERKVRIPP